MKTTATTEVVSSPPVEKWYWSQQWRQNTSPAGKNRWRTEKLGCKSMKQDENEQNSEKQPTRVAGKKPYGKCQMKRFLLTRPKILTTFLAAAVSLALGSIAAAQEAPMVLSNTNEPMDGSTLIALTEIGFAPGSNAEGYIVTGISLELGDDSAVETGAQIQFDLIGPANIPYNSGFTVSNGLFAVDTPSAPGTYYFPFPTNVFIAGNNPEYPPSYYTFYINALAPSNGPYANYYFNLPYTTSTNYEDPTKWVFAGQAGEINGSSDVQIPFFSIYAYPLGSANVAYKGNYNGLFAQPSGPDYESAGAIKKLAVNANGHYSGTVLLAGMSYAISGIVGAGGAINATLHRTWAKGGPVAIALSFSTDANGVPTYSGTVSNASWLSGALALAATNATPSGQFTMTLAPATNGGGLPGGYGIASITNYAGTAKNPGAAYATISGATPDNVWFTETTGVAADGRLPLFASLYNGAGFLTGWLDLQDGTNAVTNGLTWVHPTRAAGAFRSAFTETFAPQDIQFSPWIDSSNIWLGLTNLVVGSNNYPVSINGKGKISGSSITGSVAPHTGAWSVTGGKGAGRYTASGEIVAAITNGAGFSLSKSNSIPVLLTQ